jgi:hypothetical protein
MSYDEDGCKERGIGVQVLSGLVTIFLRNF